MERGQEGRKMEEEDEGHTMMHMRGQGAHRRERSEVQVVADLGKMRQRWSGDPPGMATGARCRTWKGKLNGGGGTDGGRQTVAEWANKSLQ